MSAAVDAVQLSGRMITVTVLRVQDTNLTAIATKLDERLRLAPSLAALPAVLDVEALGVQAMQFDLPALVQTLGERDMRLIGVRDSGDPAHALAGASGLAVLRLDGPRAVQRAPEAEAQPAPAPAASGAPASTPAPVATRTLTVTQPVRSGQQVYARGGDLVLLAAVSAGAEVVADGSIHAYGRLRGRAIAGVQGDAGARIYCQRLEAELLAIAGYYRLSEEGDAGASTGPVQVRLDGEALRIEPL